MPKKLTILDAQTFAKKANGICLSGEYISNHSNLKWQCEKGHTFLKPLKKVNLGEWCPQCSGKYVVLDATELNDIAKKRGGEFLTNSDLKVSHTGKWKCSNGHVWESSVYNVVNLNSWCPICNTNNGEQICRFIFEKLTGKKFPTKRPNWLKTKDQTRAMEIDGFNEELLIGFEHQGKQHYENTISFFNSTEVIRRDNLKREIYKKKGVKVLEVPQIGELISLIEAITLIKKFLTQNKIEIKSSIKESDIRIDQSNVKNNQLKELQEIANLKGGKCLSTVYQGHVQPLLFECKNQHQWMARPNDIKRGSWCSICMKAGGKRKNLEWLNTVGTRFGIICISPNYDNSKTKYLWKCAHGHEFESRYDNLLNMQGCPVCKRL